MLYYLIGKMIRVSTVIRKTKTPSSANTRGFLFRFGQGGLFLRLTTVIFLVQPFANVVGSYSKTKCRKFDTSYILPLLLGLPQNPSKVFSS